MSAAVSLPLETIVVLDVDPLTNVGKTQNRTTGGITRSCSHLELRVKRARSFIINLVLCVKYSVWLVPKFDEIA